MHYELWKQLCGTVFIWSDSGLGCVLSSHSVLRVQSLIFKDYTKICYPANHSG